VQSQFFRFLCLFLLLFQVTPSAKSTDHWQIDRWHYEPRSYQALAKESLLTQTELLSDSQLTELRSNISINSDSKLLNKHVGYSEKDASKDISASNDDNFTFTDFNPSARADAESEPNQQPPNSPIYASLLYPIVCDHLGTPKELYNAQGECVWQAQHSLWGKLSLVKSKSYNPTQAVIEQNAGSNDYKEDLDFQLPNHSCELRFAGQWFDAESGLHYNYNRYYDPNSGQYLSQDPIGLAGGMRTQAYVTDPVHWVDPLGLQATGTVPAAKTLPSSGGVVRQFEQVGDKVYYRVFSGDAKAGAWLTSVPPKSSAWAQEALALPPGNKANMIQEVLVPNGTLLERSRAIPMPEWGRMRGGAEQFKLLDQIPLKNFGPGKPLP
jgi:RHS repeat-associated protein